MKLVVSISSPDSRELAGEWELRAFGDDERIARKVALAVRDWMRTVPVSKQGRRMRLNVFAQWHEQQQPAPAPAPRAPAKVVKHGKGRK